MMLKMNNIELCSCLYLCLWCQISKKLLNQLSWQKQESSKSKSNFVRSVNLIFNSSWVHLRLNSNKCICTCTHVHTHTNSQDRIQQSQRRKHWSLWLKHPFVKWTFHIKPSVRAGTGRMAAADAGLFTPFFNLVRLEHSPAPSMARLFGEFGSRRRLISWGVFSIFCSISNA